MTEITFGEFQEYFEDYIERVENGESFLIKGGSCDFVILPVSEHEELIRISNRD
jgi:hypothetical protein